jgi:periplasmic divalent cation tolerance protein
MRTQPDACEIVFTAPDAGWLAQFTDALVADRLCAAAHRFPPIASTYWWRGEMRREVEHRASLHTRISLTDAVVSRIEQEHPYEVPGVAVLPIIGGNSAYLEWIIAETVAPDAP